MDPDYAAAYPDLSKRHWWWRARRSWIRRELRRLAPEDGSHRLLEVGCATGSNFPVLQPFGTVTGLEPNAAFREADPRILPIPLDGEFQPEEPFDFVLLLDVLEHVESRTEFLRQARRVLRPGGHLLLTVPAHRWLWTRHDARNHHLLRYSIPELRSELATADLQSVRMRFAFHGLVFPKLGMRAIEGALPAGGAPRVPPTLLNSLAYGYARAEAQALGPLALPFGSSLLAIARPVEDG